MIVAGTGHRPHKLGTAGEDALRRFARRRLECLSPTQVISGMAPGWDQAIARAAVDIGIPFIAAVPFAGYGKKYCGDALWGFMWLLAEASHIEIISDTPGQRALQMRNEWMVDRADIMLALWDGSWGGTFNCLEYAKKRSVSVENVWSLWERENDPDILV